MANVSKHSPFFIFYIQFLFLRCLLASYIKIPDAMAAFKDSTLPSMGIRIRAVSYTHLDVYKRQLFSLISLSENDK